MEDSKQPAIPTTLVNGTEIGTSASNGGRDFSTPNPDFDKVMRHLHTMPMESIGDYTEASQENPSMVQQETMLDQYLDLEQGNIASTASKIVAYWKLKKQVCGASRFVLPLDGSANSAIPPRQASCLGKGTMVLLEKADSFGQDVFYIHDCCVTQSDWLACLFFALFKISNRMASKESNGLSILVGLTHQHHYQSCVRNLFEFVESAFPLWIKQVHILSVSTRNEEPVAVSAVEPSYRQWLQLFDREKRGTVGCRIRLYHESYDAVVSLLAQQGFDKEVLATASLSTARDSSSNLTSWYGEIPPILQSDPSQELALENTAPVPPPPASVASSSSSRQETNSLTPSLEEGSVRALEEAIMLLPDEEKSAYCQAKREAPQIVQRDSNPLWYLKFEKFNTWDAAKRLAFYWKARLETFKERAFLPMSQTGEGALAKKDVNLFNTGYYVILPNDSEGRTVIFNDASLRPKSKDAEAGMRHFFYMNHVTMQNHEVVVEKGLVWIMILVRNNLDKLGRQVTSRGEVAAKGFPCKIHALHLLPKFQKPRSFLDEILQLLYSASRQAKINHHFHRCKNKSEAVAELTKHGLLKEGLPESVGGTWSYENFPIWQEVQLRMEWDLPLGQLETSPCRYSGSEYQAKSLSQLTEAEKVERKRRFNVLHSRRKRQRDRMESESLERQVEALQDEKDDIKGENERLIKLLSQAKELVARANSHD